MKRPMLISGITATVILALLTLIPKSAAVLVILSALVFVFSLFLKNRGKDTILISFISIVTVIVTLSFSVFTAVKITPCLKYHEAVSYIQGKVTSTPRLVNGNYVFTIKADKIGEEGVNHNISVICPEDDEITIALYDYVYLGDAKLTIPTDDKNDFYFGDIADGSLLTAYTDRIIVLKQCDKTPFFYCLKTKEAITDKINSSMSSNNAGLLSGMLFGVKSGIDYDTASAFRNSGIAHLLAVSGLHTALWCGMLLSLLKAIKVNKCAGLVICMVFLICFCIVSAFTPSVIRASLMTTCAMLAPLFKRRANSLNSLGLAVTVLLLLNPYTVQSISFQLSAAATLGVLFSTPITDKIITHFKEFPIKQVKSFIIYLLSSIVISLFSGIFTLPVSAYHFGVTPILSPIANILCVKPAFYGMLTGTVATAISFIPATLTKTAALLLFDVTEFILDLVSTVAGLFSNISFCTIPVHKEWLIAGLLLGTIMLSVGTLVYKKRKKKFIITATAITVVLSLFTCIFIPLTVPKHKNTLTVLSTGDNLCLVIRSGTRYALLTNTKKQLPADIHDYLPKATSESLDLYIATYLNGSSLYSLETINERYSPEETHITKAIETLCRTEDVTPPDNTVIRTQGKYALGDEITLEIIDTTPGQYAIIRGKEKTAYIHIFGNTSIEDVTNTSDADILVYNGNIPKVIKPQVESVVISGESDLIIDENVPFLETKCDNLYFTARDGNICINL